MEIKSEQGSERLHTEPAGGGEGGGRSVTVRFGVDLSIQEQIEIGVL